MTAPTRRRRALLAAVALAAAVAGAIAGAPGGGHSRPGSGPSPELAAARRLPLAKAAGLLVLIRFRGTAAPAYVLRALREDRAGGVILFTDNIRSRQQLRALTASLHRAGGGRPLVAVDQEGGEVRRIPWAAPVAGQPQQDASGTVTSEAARGAHDLSAAGVDVVFAPVADVTAPGSALAGRGFSADPARAAADVAAAVRAWMTGGVAPTLKHFPGLGAAQANTDRAPVTIDGPVDLSSFRAGIAAGAPLVMASHALYPALDPRHIASQSPAILGRLLRGTLGFRGVIVTDSLEARAVTSRSSVATAAVRSIAAGADLALTTGRGSFLPVLRALQANAAADPAFATRVRESAARVLALRSASGR